MWEGTGLFSQNLKVRNMGLYGGGGHLRGGGGVPMSYIDYKKC